MTDEAKIRENSDWYYANLPSLLPKYQGRYVAVADKALSKIWHNVRSD